MWGCLRSSFMVPLHNSQRGGVRHASAVARISYRSIPISLIAIMGVNWLRTNCKLPSGIAVILQLIQRVLLGAVRVNAAAP
jgi:hypothetical protein